MITAILIAVAVGFIVVERLWPAMDLPKVRAWWPRVILVNLIQLGLVIVAGISWDRWLQSASLVRLQDHLSPIWSAAVAYLVSTFVYYWWHRIRHESRFFWRLCHQLHHSPRRIEIVTSFYKHPVEITLNSILSAAIVYTLLGCAVEAGAYYTLMTAVAEFFYHWNISTPRWLGFIVQRPESHRVHHQYHHHTNNFADLPIFDMMFGTFQNPHGFEATCGYDDWREDRLEDMLAFRDVNTAKASETSPLHLLPTCIGCSKRWACTEARTRAADESPDA
ncbi:MAG: sterol desaturase family protein [Phycisphaerales bacterium]|nr:sterol desaturase family protein [Phycisphaerae bacterium]NNF42014.1 sterol desaturase family protein [Phycisphaerales bacterium]NNM25129.1 sterol desaturase family protein [Phycisphaerales bacterium]